MGRLVDNNRQRYFESRNAPGSATEETLKPAKAVNGPFGASSTES